MSQDAGDAVPWTGVVQSEMDRCRVGNGHLRPCGTHSYYKGQNSVKGVQLIGVQCVCVCEESSVF